MTPDPADVTQDDVDLFWWIALELYPGWSKADRAKPEWPRDFCGENYPEYHEYREMVERIARHRLAP